MLSVYAYLSDGAVSKVSIEACAILSDVAPVITHVSVNTTDEVNGELLLKWSKPDDLDTIAHPGQYKYDVYSAKIFLAIIVVFIKTIEAGQSVYCIKILIQKTKVIIINTFVKSKLMTMAAN